jgi:uncharacterized membrane protein YidH (DUF202 family)
VSSRPPLRDPGAQAERTLLAWTRTCIALAAVVLLLLRLTVEGLRPALLTVPPLLLTAIGLQLAARRRYRSVSSGSDEQAGPLLTAMAVAAVAVAVACALTVLG